MSKIALVLAAGGGYVLGARAGRERYEQIKNQATRLWRDPRVEDARSQARQAASEAGAQAKDKATQAGSQVKDAVAEKVSSSSGAQSPTGGTSPHEVPTPNDMPEHPAAPGNAVDGPHPTGESS